MTGLDFEVPSIVIEGRPDEAILGGFGSVATAKTRPDRLANLLHLRGEERRVWKWKGEAEDARSIPPQRTCCVAVSMEEPNAGCRERNREETGGLNNEAWKWWDEL